MTKINLDDLAKRKDFLDFDERDAQLLRELGERVDDEHLTFLDRFYEKLAEFSELRELLGEEEDIARLKAAQTRYFNELLGGQYGEDYAQERLRVGITHQRIGLEPDWYLGGYRDYLDQLFSVIHRVYGHDRSKAQAVFAAVLKIAFFDISLAIDTYIDADRRKALSYEQGFHDVFEHSPDGIVIHRQGNIIYINPSLLRTMGLRSPKEVLGRSVVEFIAPDELPAIQQRIEYLRNSGRASAPRETLLLRADGTPLQAETAGVAIEFDGGPAIVTMVRDITERKELNARIMQMDRMIAAGTLAAGVGHEINNPLTYVKGNLDYAIDQLHRLRESVDRLEKSVTHKPVEMPPEAQPPRGLASQISAICEALEDARQGSDRIRRIVAQLRSLTNDHDNEGCTIDATKMLQATIEMASNEIRHRARLSTDFNTLPALRGKESKLSQVFLNLIINAAQAIDEGAVDDNEICVRTRLLNPTTASIEVEDTGAGISPEHMDRLFDPFFTTKEVGQGTGLGLHISQHIVNAYGGRIEVESQPGKGSLFRVIIPLCDLTKPNCPPEVDSDPDAIVRGRILIIDDEPMGREVLLRLLHQTQDVILAESGHQALELLDGGERFDMILCDLMMPQMTGMDFHQILQEKFPDYTDRVVFMSGGAFTPRAQKFLDQSTNPFLEKPIAPHKLHTMVARFVELKSEP